MSDDLISRAEAIKALHHVDEYNGRSIEAIKNLPPAEVTLCHLGSPCEYQNAEIVMPSAQPDTCDGCMWEDAFGYGECYRCKRAFSDMYVGG